MHRLTRKKRRRILAREADERQAKEEAEELKAQGMDVVVDNWLVFGKGKLGRCRNRRTETAGDSWWDMISARQDSVSGITLYITFWFSGVSFSTLLLWPASSLV